MNSEGYALIAALIGGGIVTLTSAAAFFAWVEKGARAALDVFLIAAVLSLLGLGTLAAGFGAGYLIFNLIA